MNAKKIKAVREWKKSVSLHEVRSTLRMDSCFIKCLLDFSKITTPLNKSKSFKAKLNSLPGKEDIMRDSFLFTNKRYRKHKSKINGAKKQEKH